MSAVRLVFPAAYRDIVGLGEVVRASDTEWTLARVSLLTNAPPTGRVRAGFVGHGRVGLRISRADLAAFLLSALADHTWVRRAPLVGN